MKHSRKKINDPFQTYLLDFCGINTQKGKPIKNSKEVQIESQKQLEKIVKNRIIKKNSLILKDHLNENWKFIEDNNCFISKDGFMVLSDLSNYEKLINSMKIQELLEILDKQCFNKFLLKESNKNIIAINEFEYRIENLQEIAILFDFSFRIFQSIEEGLLICQNLNELVLIAPIRY